MDGQEEYVRQVLEAYRETPGTMGTVRHAGRLPAAQLHQRGLSLKVIENALALAAMRRLIRPSEAPPPGTIRSLAHFPPVIEEVLESHVSPEYFEYLRYQLARTVQPSPNGSLLPSTEGGQVGRPREQCSPEPVPVAAPAAMSTAATTTAVWQAYWSWGQSPPSNRTMGSAASISEAAARQPATPGMTSGSDTAILPARAERYSFCAPATFERFRANVPSGRRPALRARRRFRQSENPSPGFARNSSSASPTASVS